MTYLQKMLISATTILSALGAAHNTNAQCTITGNNGASVTISTYPVQVVNTGSGCVSGYNYNLKLQYNITVSGGPLYTLQQSVVCTDGTHGVYSYPLAGGSGNLTTSSSVWRPATDCATATPASVGCLNATPTITINGQNFPSQTVSCAFNSSPLPLSLLSFDATTDNNKVQLKWIIAHSAKNNTYNLQRSTDVKNWQSIYKTTAIENKTTTTSNNVYSYTDDKPLNGMSYYRIEEQDETGSYFYSQIIAVQANNYQDADNIVITQNPIKNNTINIKGLAANTNWQATITDITGRQVSTINTISNNNLTIATPNLDKGLYLLHLYNRQNGETKQIKFAQE